MNEFGQKSIDEEENVDPVIFFVGIPNIVFDPLSQSDVGAPFWNHDLYRNISSSLVILRMMNTWLHRCCFMPYIFIFLLHGFIWVVVDSTEVYFLVVFLVQWEFTCWFGAASLKVCCSAGFGFWFWCFHFGEKKGLFVLCVFLHWFAAPVQVHI